MSDTGLSVFDRTIQKSMIWINDLAAKLGWENRENVFKALRVTLHILRDRVPTEEAVEFGAQLPVILAGFYYEDYRPTATPTKERTKEAFLNKVQHEFQRINLDAEPEPVVRAVFQTIAEHITQGKASDMAVSFPKELQDLWPQTVRA